MNQPHIYLDMDGVMVDFVGGVLRTWPTEVTEHVQSLDWLRNLPDRVPPSAVYRRRPMVDKDIDSWNIEARLRVPREDFWNRIGHHTWWAALESYPWSTHLFEMLTSYAPVTYLSSPSHSPGAAAGKLEWIKRRHGPGFDDWIFTNQKVHVAGPGRILIDDSDRNCEAWVAAGGRAILFPQYWNSDRGTRISYPQGEWSGSELRMFVARVEAAVRRALS